MADDFFADFLEPCLFSYQGNISVHFAVNFYFFNHFIFICFQSAVEVVDLNFGGAACDSVIEFRCYLFDERVVAYFFPSGDDVVAVFHDHSIHFGQFIGAVLHIGVHSKHDVPRSCFKSFVQGG